MKNIAEKDAVLELYRATVRRMLASDKPGVVPNASFQHASIILEELVRCAELRMFAFCEKLSPDVWSPSVLEQLQLAVARNVDVQIVLTAEPEIVVPPFLEGRIKTLKGVHPSSLEKLGHFAVVDGKSLRLEENRTTRQALFAANLPQVARELEAIFAFLRRKAS